MHQVWGGDYGVLGTTRGGGTPQERNTDPQSRIHRPSGPRCPSLPRNVRFRYRGPIADLSAGDVSPMPGHCSPPEPVPTDRCLSGMLATSASRDLFVTSRGPWGAFQEGPTGDTG